MKKCILLMIITTIFAADQHTMLEKLLQYSGQKTFFLSYPRSGNTWLRYCAEYLTLRPTFHRFNFDDHRNYPIGWLAEFAIDIEKTPIEKVHTVKEINKCKANSQYDKLVLIIRNPKEVFIRHNNLPINLEMLEGEGAKGNADPRIYFENLNLYHTWKSQNRLLIYYEDLIKNPTQVLKDLLTFLDEKSDRLAIFMEKYEWHKKKAIKLYKASETQGNDLLQHSRLIDPEHRKQVDKWIAFLHPHLWNLYLNAYYSEENLVYA